MLDVLGNFGVISSSNYELYHIFSLSVIRIFIKKKGISFKSKVYILFSLITVKGEEVWTFDLFLDTIGFFISSKFFIKFR